MSLRKIFGRRYGSVLMVLLSAVMGSSLTGCGSDNTSSTGNTSRNAPNRLVFTTLDPPKAGIYTANPDGSGVVLLGNGEGAAGAQFSFDGSKIIFSAGSGISRLYVMNADGTNLHTLSGTSQFADAMQPAFSPDGIHVAFVSAGSLYTIHADGTDLINISATHNINHAAQFPEYSPDGKSLLFVGTDGNTGHANYFSHVGLTPVNGTSAAYLTNSGLQTDARFSPDGSKIVYTSNGNIWLMHADGSHQQQLTHVGVTDHSPAFSPDGKRIVFATNRDNPNAPDYFTDSGLYIMNADGTGQTPLHPASSGLTGIYGLDWR